MMAAKVAVVSEAREGEQGVSKAGSVSCLESRLDELHNVLQAVSGNKTAVWRYPTSNGTIYSQSIAPVCH